MDVRASFDAPDAAAEGVRLRVEMQRAVEEERCATLAAKVQLVGGNSCQLTLKHLDFRRQAI